MMINSVAIKSKAESGSAGEGWVGVCPGGRIVQPEHHYHKHSDRHDHDYELHVYYIMRTDKMSGGRIVQPEHHYHKYSDRHDYDYELHTI